MGSIIDRLIDQEPSLTLSEQLDVVVLVADELLDALRDTRKRLWERRFEFSDADHDAMDKASEAIRKAKGGE